jgi:hypothetical protein
VSKRSKENNKLNELIKFLMLSHHSHNLSNSLALPPPSSFPPICFDFRQQNASSIIDKSLRGPNKELALHRLLLFIYAARQLQQQQRASSIVDASLEFKG